MLPRLEAERQLDERALLLSTGGRGLKDDDARRYSTDLELQRDGGRRTVRKSTPREIAAMNIKVKLVPPKAETAQGG